MNVVDTIHLAKEAGLPIVISIMLFYFCFWVVKFVVTKMCASLDQLVQRMDVFTTRVREEHKKLDTSFDAHHASVVDYFAKHQKDSDERHKEMMTEHREMINTLGRINGYKS